MPGALAPRPVQHHAWKGSNEEYGQSMTAWTGWCLQQKREKWEDAAVAAVLLVAVVWMWEILRYEIHFSSAAAPCLRVE